MEIFSPRLQEHDFFPDFDLNLSPDWEFNFGVGIGATGSTDHLVIKMILGYRFRKEKLAPGVSWEEGLARSPEFKPFDE